jgi:hypothetical protein
MFGYRQLTFYHSWKIRHRLPYKHGYAKEPINPYTIYFVSDSQKSKDHVFFYAMTLVMITLVTEIAPVPPTAEWRVSILTLLTRSSPKYIRINRHRQMSLFVKTVAKIPIESKTTLKHCFEITNKIMVFHPILLCVRLILWTYLFSFSCTC